MTSARARWTRQGLGVLVPVLVVACFDHDAAAPDRLPARLVLAATVLSAGESVDIRLGFLRGTDPTPVPLANETFAVAAPGPQDYEFEVDLAGCLETRTPGAEPSCRLVADALLRDVTSQLLDSTRIGPFEARPGAAVTSPPATLQAPAEIEVESGNGQLGWAARELLHPVIVRLRDRAGGPIAGRTLRVDAVTGGGSAPGSTVVTDADGRATVRYTLGALTGAQSFRVTGPAALTATLGATAIPVLRRGLVAGFAYTCALDVAGFAECWGDNRAGTLGNPVVTTTTPIIVSVQTAVRFVSLSASHGNNINTGNICGLTAAGRAYCWGTTGPGAYGAPTPDTCNPFGGAPRQCSRVPSPVGFGPDFMQIDVGGTEARLCGVTTDGDAYCVGHGVNGELGNGTMASSGGFVPVSGGHKWLQISVGNRQTCGLTTAGEVWCWGANDHGLLGDGTTDASAVPVRVASSAAYRFVNAGFERGCAITISDEVHCWGERDVYTLPGNLGSTPDVLVPTSVAGAPAAVSVEIGIENFCAITPAQEAWCWGYDRGQGSMASGRAYQGQPYVAPARVAISGSITELAAGLLHTCVRLSSGTIACAGSNIFGQLGLGVTGGPFVLSPIPVVRPGAAGPPVSMSALVDTLLWRSTPTGARPTFYDATGRSWPYDPSVLVTDAAGRGVPGVTVIWSPLTPGSSVPGSNTTLTDASGRATQTGWVLGPAAGRYTLQASVNGIVTALRFHADAILPGPPATLLTSPQELAGGLGEVTASLLLARVMDANSFALAGVPVQVTRSRATAPPSQSVPAIPGTFTTDALGEVRITTWTFDTVQVLDTVSVHVPGITTAPQVAFVLYSANRPEVTSLPETITAGQPIDSPIEIEIRDWNGNLDASFNGTVFLGATSQTTSLSLGTVTATGGRAVFAGAVFPEAGTYTLSAFVQYLGRFGRSYGQLATVVVAP